MKPLGDFLGEQLRMALPARTKDSGEAANSGALVAFQEGVPEAEAKALGAALEKFAASKECAQAVNAAVPPPKSGESEDEFVERAKASLRSLLLAKFGK